MTATTKPSWRAGATRPIRFSSMESLGFSDAASVWSDSPIVVDDELPRGRHVAPPPEPDAFADWQPQDLGSRLDGGNLRWSLIVVFVIALGAISGLAYWIYQRPAAQAEASLAAITTQAVALEGSLPALADLNSSLTEADALRLTSVLFEVDGAARALFEGSAALPSSEIPIRSDAAAAASAALDAVRLVGDAHAYRMAVLPILVAPALETDPTVIELDEAARAFGDWQLRLDGVRTALPDGVLPEVTAQLDILSADLSNVLSEYLERLRLDDMTSADAVIADLGVRLGDIAVVLETSVQMVQGRVDGRLGEARDALIAVLGF